MATISQIRGMFLEEALLVLLRASGYGTVDRAGEDPTLRDGPSGLEVRGRGGVHQIDSIADYRVHIAFTNPQRLLVEAKCFSDSYPVGIQIVRNAVGVVKDASEYWVPAQNGAPARGRYHYQYALFSASDFTEPAERYAFAHDIYLIPLARSSFIRPLIQAIRNISHQDFDAPAWNAINIGPTELRRLLRRSIRQGTEFVVPGEQLIRFSDHFVEFIDLCRRIGGALLATLAGRFPIFLVPEPRLALRDLPALQSVRIYWDDSGWYLRDTRGMPLFSFDLPPSLFDLYAENGVLTNTAALSLKANVLNEFHAIFEADEAIRVVTFRLDYDWLSRITDRLRRIPRRPERQGTEPSDLP